MVLLSHEQQAVEALPEDARHKMAQLALAGVRFRFKKYHTLSWWNATHANGSIVARSTLFATIEAYERELHDD